MDWSEAAAAAGRHLFLSVLSFVFRIRRVAVTHANIHYKMRILMVENFASQFVLAVVWLKTGSTLSGMEIWVHKV